MQFRKITGPDEAAEPVKPDFGMLMAAFAAAQAQTPTAIANGQAHTIVPPGEALTRLFGDRLQDGASTLNGSFRPGLPGDADPADQK